MKIIILIISIFLFLGYINYTETQRFEIKQNLELEKAKLHSINLEKTQKVLLETLKTKVKYNESDSN